MKVLAATALAGLALSALPLAAGTAGAAPPPMSTPASASGDSASTTRGLVQDPVNVCASVDDTAAVSAASPGDLLAAPQDVTEESGLVYGRLYRVLYATTGGAGTVEATCGLIAVPEEQQLAGVIAWAHGTRGLTETCQPSTNPAGFVGPMPGGIGAPSADDSQQDGALVHMLQSGAAVVATDYYSLGEDGSTGLQHYVMGVPEAAAVLDSARVLTGNAAAFGLTPVAPGAELPLVTWGHSQGGGSALWAGQLARQYLALHDDSTLDLAGVAALAPATQYTTSPGQPRKFLGKHLGDRDMYNMNPGLGVPFPIGAALFSYVTASWSQVENADSGALPFGPTASVSLADVLSPQGQATAPVAANYCLNGPDALKLIGAVSKYLNPNQNRFFAAPFAGSNSSGRWVGGIDATCSDPSSFAQGVQDWCAWLQFNMPGPYGVNPYAKVPLDNDGAKVPIYLAQGRNDRVMWCVSPLGIVTGPACLTAQFRRSLLPEYCLGQGHLQTDYVARTTHLGLPAAVSSNPSTGDYEGSPLDEFMDAALDRSLPKRCTVNNLPAPPS